MTGPIYGSKAQHIANRVGSEIFSLAGKKLFDVDTSGNLLNPLTKKIEGHLRPAGEMPPEASMDNIFKQ
jgi:hypothetical protein